jgi:hypothetical protein
MLLTGSGFRSSLPMTSPTPGAADVSTSLVCCSTVSASLGGEGSTRNCPAGLDSSYSTADWFSNCDTGLSYGNTRKYCRSVRKLSNYKERMVKE